MEIRRWWYAFAEWLCALVEEAAFRVALACRVLVGRVPLRTEKRSWSRVVEAPVLLSCYDWTTDRLIFSCLVWPPLEVEPPQAAYAVHEERVEEVIKAISRGAAEMTWSMRWEIDDSLRWDYERQVWTGEDGFAYAAVPLGEALGEAGAETGN